MQELQQEKINEVSGGFFFAPFIWGCVLGGVSYTVNHRKRNEFCPEEFAMATVGGGVSGGLGAVGVVGRGLQVACVANTALAIENHNSDLGG